MKKITVDSIKKNGWLVFELITGSKAYGLDNSKSDTDIKGVFVLPKELYYGLEYVEQVSNETNDIVYYELKRFVELLTKNNPNILEMLNVPEHCVLLKHNLMNEFTSKLFLSKLCEKTFASYAFTQIKKAYGLEKKILNPVEEKRKTILDFCFIYREKDAVPLLEYLQRNNIELSKVGLASIAHIRDCYNLYYSKEYAYSGIIKDVNSNDVHLSNIPKGEEPIAILYFNKDRYSVYCKKYKEYWDWVEKRNNERYKNTLSHGKKYDAKNMLHVFRLLKMAKEIATENSINVYRKDRTFLLSIKAGEFEYEQLVKMAEKLKDELSSLFHFSNLQDEPDIELIEKLLVKTREQFYQKQKK